MPVGTVASTKLYIGPSTLLAADATSPDQYVEIKNVGNLGDLGRQFANVTLEEVDSGYTKELKGTESFPPFELVLNRNDTDPGQDDVREASANRNSLYPFRLVENDGEGVLGASTRIYFLARIFSFTRRYGGVNNLKQVVATMQVEPDSIKIYLPNTFTPISIP